MDNIEIYNSPFSKFTEQKYVVGDFYDRDLDASSTGVNNFFLITEHTSSLDNPTFNRYQMEKMLDNLQLLDSFSRLKKNWNENNAKPFNSQLLTKCANLIKKLRFQPEVFPTARNSIQFEFTNRNNDYLELEIFKEKIIYLKDINGEETTGNIQEDGINVVLEMFYA